MVNNRIIWIDWAKAIGIYLVVLGHYNLTNKDITGYIFMFHMALFFFISGLLTSKKSMDYNWKVFLKKKTMNIIIPYLLFQFINGIWPTFLILTGREFNYSEMLISSIIGLPLKMFCGPGWFLLALFWCNILIKFNKLYINIVLLTIIFVMRYKIGSSFPLSIDTVPIAFIYFASAYYLKQYILRIIQWLDNNKFINLLLVPTAFILVGVVYNIIGQQNLLLANITNSPLLSILTAYVGIYAICGISILLSKFNNRFITQISNSTLFIMCTHMILLSFISVVVDIQSNIIIAIISSLIITFGLTLITPYIKKKFPLLMGNRK